MTTSERGMGVGELTLERLSELRRIAEAATPPNEQCPRCGVPWTLGRDVGGRVHTPGGMDCLRRQLAQAQEQLRAALAREVRLRRLQQKVQSAAVLAVAAEQVLKAWVMGDYLAPFMDDLENALLDFDGPVASEAVWEDIEPDGEEGGGGE